MDVPIFLNNGIHIIHLTADNPTVSDLITASQSQLGISSITNFMIYRNSSTDQEELEPDQLIADLITPKNFHPSNTQSTSSSNSFIKPKKTQTTVFHAVLDGKLLLLIHPLFFFLHPFLTLRSPPLPCPQYSVHCPQTQSRTFTLMTHSPAEL
eukprot:TRINITY_DN3199_c0_g1_i8.p1 TRINITY_DN3199_c0_g1~~TRINITY_DN3199_c0_g1_i8.p1  ORF type:complete len:153 (+),score=14.17 TRINITY_DN3199_c0_g1_i8:392-850(+)